MPLLVGHKGQKQGSEHSSRPKPHLAPLALESPFNASLPELHTPVTFAGYTELRCVLQVLLLIWEGQLPHGNQAHWGMDSTQQSSRSFRACPEDGRLPSVLLGNTNRIPA
jgi:hypothetical protein